jgi:hypothetical protein
MKNKGILYHVNCPWQFYSKSKTHFCKSKLSWTGKPCLIHKTRKLAILYPTLVCCLLKKNHIYLWSKQLRKRLFICTFTRYDLFLQKNEYVFFFFLYPFQIYVMLFIYLLMYWVNILDYWYFWFALNLDDYHLQISFDHSEKLSAIKIKKKNEEQCYFFL